MTKNIYIYEKLDITNIEVCIGLTKHLPKNYILKFSDISIDLKHACSSSVAAHMTGSTVDQK